MKLPDGLQQLEDELVQELCKAYFDVNRSRTWPTELLGQPPHDYHENELNYLGAISDEIASRVPERTLSLAWHELSGGCAEDWIRMRYSKHVIYRAVCSKVKMHRESNRRLKREEIAQNIQIGILATALITAIIVSILTLF